jgi:tetratricopeptide (TPR) repeat protein
LALCSPSYNPERELPPREKIRHRNSGLLYLGSQYVLGLKAVSCRTGDALAEEQEPASGKEKILAALDKAALTLRKRLGESFNTLDKFDTPLEQATTPSLEALQAYSLGWKSGKKDERFEAIPFFERAILLDPNFAMAYAAMGAYYAALGETALGGGKHPEGV